MNNLSDQTVEDNQTVSFLSHHSTLWLIEVKYHINISKMLKMKCINHQ